MFEEEEKDITNNQVDDAPVVEENNVVETDEDLQETEKTQEPALVFSDERIEKLTEGDVKLLYQRFVDTKEEEAAAYIEGIYKKIDIPKITFPPLGYRIWTYFYEKSVIRVILLIWFFTRELWQKFLNIKYPLPLEIVYLNLPEVLTKALFADAGTKIALGTMVYMAGFFILIFLWRLYIAYHESSLNTKSSGMSPMRKTVRIMIVNRYGRPVNFALVFLRGLFRMQLIAIIQILLLELSGGQRLLHDIVFQTYVVQLNADVTEEEIAEFISNS